jgi:hypothetical protein
MWIIIGCSVGGGLLLILTVGGDDPLCLLLNLCVGCLRTFVMFVYLFVAAA